MRLSQISPRRFFVVLAAALLAATAGTVVLTQQTANASTSQCDYEFVCIYKDANYSGWMARFSVEYHEINHECVNVPSGTNDKTSSVYYNGNTSWVVATFYKDANCRGDSKNVVGGPHSGYPKGYSNLRGTGFNDTFSSVRLVFD